MIDAPPGWYADPAAPGFARYWDSERWAPGSRTKSTNAQPIPDGAAVPADTRDLPLDESGDRWSGPRSRDETTASDGPVIATRSQRFTAIVVDYLVVAPLTLGIQAILGLSFGTKHHGATTGRVLEGGAVTLPIVLIVIVMVMARTNGQSPGKRAAGLRVVRNSGTRVDFKFACWREIAIKWILFSWPLLLPAPWRSLVAIWLLDFAWLLFSADRRALHDVIAGTRVIVDAPSSDPIAAEPVTVSV